MLCFFIRKLVIISL